MVGTARLEVKDVRRSFGARAALAGVDLRLEPGEIYALLGRNGAGKTTLVRAVCGRVRLEGGEVRVCGQDPRASRAARQRLGLVPQEIALYPDLTARENLDVLGRLAGLRGKAVRTATDRLLDWIGLADRADSRVETLSGGMKRRVNLAAGILHEPEVLLLDEPTAGVDPQARERIHELLLDLRARGMSILLTTHDLDQAAALADRIGILDEGQLKAEGTLRQLVARHFGETRRLTLQLAVAPPSPATEGLHALGLTPAAEDPRRWAGSVPGELRTLSAVEERLARLGIAAVETGLREPGLWDVFFAVTGKELAS